MLSAVSWGAIVFKRRGMNVRWMTWRAISARPYRNVHEPLRNELKVAVPDRVEQVEADEVRVEHRNRCAAAKEDALDAGSPHHHFCQVTWRHETV